MKKYNVEVTRTSYSTRIITVEANSEEEAKEIAVDEAGDYEFSEHSSEYSANDVVEGNPDLNDLQS